MHCSARSKPVNRSAAALVADKRFKCTECGKCCTGNGEVWANMAECSAIAVHLQVPLGHFLDTYCKPYENSAGWRRLKYKDTPDKVRSALLLQTSSSGSDACCYMCFNNLAAPKKGSFSMSLVRRNLLPKTVLQLRTMQVIQLLCMCCRSAYFWKTSFARFIKSDRFSVQPIPGGLP